MEIGIVVAMRLLAQAKHQNAAIEPYPGKTWKQCYEHYPDQRIHFLGYHIKGEKSSKAVTLKY